METGSFSAAGNAAPVDVSAMSTAELRVHLERCERLLSHPELLVKLADKGQRIRDRHRCFTLELDRRAQLRSTVEQQSTQEAARTDRVTGSSSIPAMAAIATANHDTEVRAIAEKYKDYRVPVEDTVRRMYGGSLSEREIQRILADVPPNFFLTYSETCDRQAWMAKEKRLSELQQLREMAALRQQNDRTDDS